MFLRRLNFIHNWIAQFASFEFLRLKELFVWIYDQVNVSNLHDEKYIVTCTHFAFYINLTYQDNRLF